MMLYTIFNKLDRIFHFEEAKAHCDIPCGIYDPAIAQISALTVIRMMDLMHDLERESKDDLELHNKSARYISVKEEHAEACKREIRVIWGDYMKPEHTEKYPELDKLVFQIMKLASETKQTVKREKGLELLQKVNRFAEIFWQTKGIEVKRRKAPYKPEEEVVYPVLQ
jgi:nickel superoxide dismutase